MFLDLTGGYHAGPLFVPVKRRAPVIHGGTLGGKRRRRREKRATPPWADMEAIRALYREAARLTRETGELHVVDHIVPLAGKLVCGLHVHWNLQVMHWLPNARKSWMTWPDMPFEQIELFGAAQPNPEREDIMSEAHAKTILQQVPVVRDENGYWSHPDLIHFWHVDMQDAERCSPEQWEALETRASIKTKIVHLEAEPMEHPAYVSYFDNDNPDISGWDPSPPPGWWLIDICDNEDGPFAVWATHADTVGARS